MPEEFILAQGDTSIDLSARLKDKRGYVDLTTAVVTLTVCKLHDSGPIIDSAPCIPFPDQTNASEQGDRGKVRHVWQTNEVALLNKTQRNYSAHFTVVRNGQTATFPRKKNESYILITVV